MLAPHVIEGGAGPLFLMTYASPPASTAANRFLVVAPAFAEEMNRSRRTLHRLGVELCRRGISLVIPDLTGTGDSSGNFADARWAIWKDDLVRTVQWVVRTFVPDDLSVLGVRLGAPMAGECAADMGLDQLLFWQPVDGRRNLREFLRIWEVANTTSGGKRLAASEVLATEGRIEIGGYLLTAELAEDIGNVQVDFACSDKVSLHWFELGSGIGPASARTVERLRGNGAKVVTLCSESAPFWRIQETTVADDLVRMTVSALEPFNAR